MVGHVPVWSADPAHNSHLLKAAIMCYINSQLTLAGDMVIGDWYYLK